MPRHAPAQRSALADALLAAGPHAPTLCEGWTAADLAAHVVLRDRRPDAALGMFVAPLAGHLERVQRGYRDGRSYPDLVALVRSAPRFSPMSLPPLDEAANTAEFFIHTEDVRRAQPDWQPRPLEPGLAAALWGGVRRFARLSLRRFDAPVRVRAAGHGEFTVGAGEPRAEVSGDPGELLLFFSGRQRVARVALTGEDELVARLRTARLGI